MGGDRALRGGMHQEPGAEGGGRPPAAGRRLRGGLERGLELSRWLVLIAVVVLILSAAGAFAYGTAVFVNGVQAVVAHPFPVGNRVGLFLLVIDFFLIGATLAIAAIGFYELFIGWVRARGGGRCRPGCRCTTSTTSRRGSSP